jgi:signal transduction histidine kinase
VHWWHVLSQSGRSGSVRPSRLEGEAGVVPPAFLATLADPSVASTNAKSYADILREASTTMVRACMLILQDGLIDTFSDKTKMEQKDSRSAAGLALPRIYRETSSVSAREMETALFRIVQECHTNVHRHSGSKDASIRLARENGSVVLEVPDVGQGPSQGTIGASRKTGGGIRGMQERVRLLNGVMEFLDARPGTVVRVKLPCPTSACSESAADLNAAGKARINDN